VKDLTPKQQAMKAAFKAEKEMDDDYEDTAFGSTLVMATMMDALMRTHT
jgi:hypothetical protein